jgi:heme a synthase
LLIGMLFRRRRELPGTFAIALVLLGVVLVQMAVGETQWRTRLPWGLVLLHVSLAAAIWGLTVLLVYLLWRPARGSAQERTRLFG